MNGRRRVGLLFGGPSPEHEVSVVSGRGVAGALDMERFDVLPIGITRGGRWLAPESSARILASEATSVVPPQSDDGVRLVVEPGRGLLRVGSGRAPEPLPLDVIFSVVHGWGGEDGRFQGLLDVAGLPCVGPGVLGSAVGMDKQVAKALFAERGLPVGPWRALRHVEWTADPAGTERAIAGALGGEVFVKPANGGSSVGITKVHAAAELGPALATAFAYDAKVVVEKALPVREIECAVLGNDGPEVSVCGEIVPSREFYDYASKYQDGTSRLAIPAPLDPATSAAIRRLALEAFRALELCGMARVDFFVTHGTGEIYLNEVNTLPGFTPISMYPKLWEATGLRYPDLLARLIDLAAERYERERRGPTPRA